MPFCCVLLWRCRFLIQLCILGSSSHVARVLTCEGTLVQISDGAPAVLLMKRSELTCDGTLVQISDGAAAVLLMKRSEALKRGLPVLGIFRSFAAVGVDPAVMGIGPAVAIPAAVEKAGLTTDDIDVYELNEAFASQVRAEGPLQGYPDPEPSLTREP